MKTPLTYLPLALLPLSTVAMAHDIAAHNTASYQIDIWADNWFAAYLNGEPLLEDSVPITTERSFNAESTSFSATLPFMLAFEIKDFKQNDTGLEYIGTRRQQMGDGGFITQVTDKTSGEVIAVSDSEMHCTVIHKAPLDTACASEKSPVAGQGSCQFTAKTVPPGWQQPTFDDSSWQHASEYSEAQVRPKFGYDDIRWDSRAKLIWTDDLEKDNTLLCRLTVDGKGATTTQTTQTTQHSALHAHFGHFDTVKTSEDSEYLLVESNGLPSHNMMKGITSWQQQVPIAQAYSGNNAWKIPLNPQLAETPLLTKDHFHRGAIAIAVNGVPIFTAMNNRGEYAADIGELDEWGGHSGRADDYHYHLAPVHLEKVVGKGNPIAYALDGFPLYGYTDKPLDEYLGRFNDAGTYQYHAVAKPPYLIAGLRGVVQVDSLDKAPEDQIEPQARSFPVRNKDYGPLNGATITGFEKTGDNSYALQYALNDKTHYVKYRWNDAGDYTFVFVDENGNETVENYAANVTKQDNPPKTQNPSPSPTRKYCGDGICDKTESQQQCPADCK